MASEEAPARVQRFGATERNLHWLHAAAFTVMLATGLVLYLPFLAQVVSARPLMKAVHLSAAVAWLTALAIVAVVGDRGALRRTRRDFEHFDDDDLRWLRARGRGHVPQGRFNAGQKAHAVVQAALSVVFVISGTLLWLGERNTALRLPGTIATHDLAMFVGGTLVAGHLFMAFAPETRDALEGAVSGTVSARYAATHHPKWRARPAGGEAGATARRPRPPRARLAAAAAIAVLGITGATLLVRDVYGPGAPRVPAVPPGGTRATLEDRGTIP